MRDEWLCFRMEEVEKFVEEIKNIVQEKEGFDKDKKILDTINSFLAKGYVKYEIGDDVY